MRTHAKPFGVVTLFAGVATMFACNGVLGIETATLDPAFESNTGGTAGTAGTASGGTGGTGGGSTGSDVPYPGCTDRTETCATCLSGCANFDMQSCLQNEACRAAIDDYRACLGPSCNLDEDCREQTLYERGEPLVDELLSCLGTSCRESCFGSPLVLMCELYCGCMKEKCTTKDIAMDVDCVSRCRREATSEGSIAYCRKYHCEFSTDPASSNPGAHCDHAIGLREQCLAPRAPEPPCEGDRVISGFPCLRDDDCCSRTCGGETCD